MPNFLPFTKLNLSILNMQYFETYPNGSHHKIKKSDSRGTDDDMEFWARYKGSYFKVMTFNQRYTSVKRTVSKCHMWLWQVWIRSHSSKYCTPLNSVKNTVNFALFLIKTEKSSSSNNCIQWLKNYIQWNEATVKLIFKATG